MESRLLLTQTAYKLDVYMYDKMICISRLILHVRKAPRGKKLKQATALLVATSVMWFIRIILLLNKLLSFVFFF